MLIFLCRRQSTSDSAAVSDVPASVRVGSAFTFVFWSFVVVLDLDMWSIQWPVWDMGSCLSVSWVPKVFGTLLSRRSVRGSSGGAQEFTDHFLGPFSWAPLSMESPRDSSSASLGFLFFILWWESWGPSCCPLSWLLLHVVSICRKTRVTAVWYYYFLNPPATFYLLESPHSCSVIQSGFYSDRGWCVYVPSCPEPELLIDF